MSAGRFRRPDVHQPRRTRGLSSRTETIDELSRQQETGAANYRFSQRSGTTFVDNIAEDVTWVVTGQYSWSGEYKGREAINDGLMGHLRSLLAAGRPRTLAFNFVAEGDYVIVEARGDNVTKSGERYDNQYCVVWRQ